MSIFCTVLLAALVGSTPSPIQEKSCQEAREQAIDLGMHSVYPVVIAYTETGLKSPKWARLVVRRVWDATPDIISMEKRWTPTVKKYCGNNKRCRRFVRVVNKRARKVQDLMELL